jgi:hypothetical protein
MKSIYMILLIFIMMPSSGCYSGINGKVVDNITGNALEGALVLVQWRKPVYESIEGISRKILLNTETLTDKEGKFSIMNTFMNPFAYPPVMIIYKEGYIPWCNDAIFPSTDSVNKNEWKNNAVHRLDKYDSKYTYSEIKWFIESPIIGYDDRQMPLTKDRLDKLSAEIRRRENTLIHMDFHGKIVDSETNKPINGALIVASDRRNKFSNGTSDQDGNIIIAGDYPMLEHPPSIVVYKKGYIVQSSWGYGSDSLHPFKWQTGYLFRLKKCDIQSSWNSLNDLIGQLDEKSNQLLRNIITQEKNER